MVRADNVQTKVHFKGAEDDFIIIVTSAEMVKKWKEDKTIPLVDVVDAFDVFCTHKYMFPALPLSPFSHSVARGPLVTDDVWHVEHFG